MLGDKSRINADRLKEQVDSLDIEPYGTVKEMMDNVTQRNLVFDRIVISTATLNKNKTMEVLHTYLREIHPRATVVFIFQGGKGDNIANNFNRIFNSPLYTDMVITTNSIGILVESATEGIDVLREKYSINKYGQIEQEVLEDTYIEEEDVITVEDSSFTKPMLVEPQSKKQKKRTGLFGVKKLNKKEVEINAINFKLITNYLKFLASLEDGMSNKKRYVMPEKERKSMSDPLEEFETDSSNKMNGSNRGNSQDINSGNFTPNPSFTQLQFGYYGFSTAFKGKPMMFRTGVRVSQLHEN